jgi:hypothetical protein
MLESLEAVNNITKVDGVDKFLSQEYPDLKDELITDLKKEKIEYSQEIENLKTTINSLKEQLHQIENLTKINETQEFIADMEFQALNLIKDTINLLVELMQKMGMNVEKVEFESVDELKLKLSKLDKDIDILKNKEKNLVTSMENDKNKLTNLDVKQQEIDKQIEFVKNSEVLDSINKLEKEYKLTNEDKEALLQAEKEIYEKLNKFHLNDFENQKMIVSLNKSLIDIKHQLQKEFDDLDFNYKDMLINGVVSGGIGAGIGGPMGTIIGFIGGVSGELIKEVSMHLGASESVAGSLQIGTDLISGVGIEKIVSKTVFEELKDLPIKTLLKDFPTRLEYMVKGILNDMKEYEFVDKNGNIIFKGKISDIIGDETIKMPYVGSNVEKSNAAGYLRDANYFGKKFLEEHPEMFSKENEARILAGKAPIVDDTWIKYHPNQKVFIGERLEHHHINNLGEATYIPQTLHRGKLNKDILHVDNDNILDSIIDTANQKLGKG